MIRRQFELGKELGTWDKNYLGLCDHIRTWSKDPSSQFGAVIVDSKGNPISFGVNGFPRGLKDTPERWNNRELKYPRVIHAEENSILFSSKDLNNCTIYVNGPPCVSCMGKISQVGISTVICYEPTEDYLKRWSISDTVEVAEETNTQLVLVGRINFKVSYVTSRLN